MNSAKQTVHILSDFAVPVSGLFLGPVSGPLFGPRPRQIQCHWAVNNHNKVYFVGPILGSNFGAFFGAASGQQKQQFGH